MNRISLAHIAKDQFESNTWVRNKRILIAEEVRFTEFLNVQALRSELSYVSFVRLQPLKVIHQTMLNHRTHSKRKGEGRTRLK